MWGERGVGGFFEDLHVLIVVVLGMSILLGSLAGAYVAHEASVKSSAFRDEATRILRAILRDPSMLHGGQRGLLDMSALDRLNSTGLSNIAAANVPLQLIVSERSGDAPRTFIVETDHLGPHRALASTAASVWHSDLDVRAARVTVALGE